MSLGRDPAQDSRDCLLDNSAHKVSLFFAKVGKSPKKKEKKILNVLIEGKNLFLSQIL